MFARITRGIVAASVLTIAVSSAAGAQAAAAKPFGVGVLVALPIGDFGDAAGMGFGAGGSWQKRLNDKLNLRVNGDLSRHAWKSPLDGNSMIFTGLANVVMPVAASGTMKPYVFGGAGLAYVRATATVTILSTTTTVTSSDTKLAINVGGGMDRQMGTRTMFFEVRFVSVQTDGSATNYIPIVVGLRM